VNKFASNHSILFSIGIFAADSIVIPLPFVIAFKVLGLEIEPLRLIIPLVQSIFIIGVLYYLGWLRVAGFGNRIKDIQILWFPLALAAVPFFIFGTIELAANIILFYGAALLFTGISEEGVARGVILKAMLPKGVWAALLFMSLLFSAGHLSNLFFENLTAIEMAMKLLVTFSFALLYGAVFLRTLNIWPLIILHTLHDISFLISGSAGPYTVYNYTAMPQVVLAVVSILYAVYIMRKVDLKAVMDQMEGRTA
jgi:membrane protease YdiL (CAAX protease family)